MPCHRLVMALTDTHGTTSRNTRGAWPGRVTCTSIQVGHDVKIQRWGAHAAIYVCVPLGPLYLPKQGDNGKMMVTYEVKRDLN
jgi:hypothetical protein